MLQKKIMKYNEMIQDIDELIIDDINNKSNLEDFEIIFKTLIHTYSDILNDDADEAVNEKMEIIQI